MLTAVLFLVTVVEAAAWWFQVRWERALHRRELELKETKRALAVDLGEAHRLYGMRERERCERAEERASVRVREAEHRMEQALQQVHDLSQQLATIRVKFPDAVPEERAYATAPHAEPYSQELMDFLGGLDSQEVRDMVTEQIEDMRERGLADSQIFHRVTGNQELSE